MRRLPPEEDPSFLGRLARAGQREASGMYDDARVPEVTPDRTIRLIVRNLNHVLNSRKRYDCVLAEFGIGDYDDPRHIDRTIRTLVSEIKEATVRFEPRLRDPEVVAASHDARLRIHLSITGTAMGQPYRLRVQFDTRTRRATVEED